MATDPKLQPIHRRVFTILYRRYRPLISAIFRRRMRDPQELDDFVHETYARMMEVASQLGIQHCKAYLIRVAQNLRTEKGLLHDLERDVLTFNSAAADTQLSQEGLSHTSDLEEVELENALKFGMEQLSPRQREVMELHCTGLADGEIAEKLGVSVDAVRQRRMQARRALQKHLWPSGQRRSAK